MTAEETVAAAVAEIRERAILSERDTPFCRAYLYAAVRHVERNCDVECGTHGEDGAGCRHPDRWDGDNIADIVNAAPSLLAELAEARRQLTALRFIADTLATGATLRAEDQQ